MSGITPFPFTAVVGMEHAKRSLLYHAIDPKIGGTLFMGHRGCAKSTLARGFAALLAGVQETDVPFIEVPLGTSEDRLLGSVDAQKLVESSQWHVRTGLIEDANGGVLYIDEINLLPDALTDLLLDSAASGHYRMERDGIQRSVSSRYILIGTMNPNEGDLRPQLSDRFAHGVNITDNFSPEERIEIVQRRLAFDDDPEKFTAYYAAQNQTLIDQIKIARQLLSEVKISSELSLAIAQKAKDLKLEGLRPELAVTRTARCAAAWAGNRSVNHENVEEAWILCLGHRPINQESSVPPQNFSTNSKDHFPDPSNRSSHESFKNPSAPQPKLNKVLPLPYEAQLKPRKINPVIFSPLIGLMNESKRKPHSAVFPSKTMAQGNPISAIDWIQSTLETVKKTKITQNKTFFLKFRNRKDKPETWIFLDASRSTGANQFLAKAKETMRSFAQKKRFSRWHLLILKSGQIKWLARKASSQNFLKKMDSIVVASGKSLLIESLQQLQSALRRGRPPHLDRVILCSDGLVTPRPGETLQNLMDRFRFHLKNLSRYPFGVSWFYPSGMRGLKGWISRLCSKASPPLQLFDL